MLSRHQLDHGEAVAIGIALDAWYAVALGRLEEPFVELYCEALATLGFALWHPALDLREADGRLSIFHGLEQFREHLGGELTLAMPDGIGAQRDIRQVDEPRMLQALARLRRCWARCRQPQA
jgi:3-dehydroquinate synthase